METPPTPFTSYPTVQRFIEDMQFKEISSEDVRSRLNILEEFCQFVERTPDEMIAEVFDPATMKYKKRNFYSTKTAEFAEQHAGSKQEQTARGNVIRNFFIANGRRLFNEKPDWL